jgi:serine/threonine protein kinase/tetratricopeptide (TPR) repeat protein
VNLAPGTVVGDRYVVEGTLGQGGMAVVYRVRHRALGTAHALKLVGAMSSSSRERLLREGRMQGQLQHPNVVAVTDHLEIQGVPAIVLELVDGPPLSHLVGSALSVPQLDALGAGILAGVAAAHQLGLVHRDLKPGNVLVAVENHKAVPKVTDFGLAVDPASDDRATRSGVTLGTPQYMSPEQVRSARDVDARADVWALGVLLYELATGSLPFDDDDRFALFQKITSGDHVPLRDRRPDLPARMIDTVESALQVDRADRPADAAALLSTWSPETRQAAVDDLALRVMELAPSRSSGSIPPAMARSEPAATWLPAATVLDRPAPAPEPSAELPPPPRPAVVPPPVAPSQGAWIAVALVTAVVLVTLGALGGLVVAGRQNPTTVVVAPPQPSTPMVLTPEPTDHPGEGLEQAPPVGFAPPTRALEALLDGRFFEAKAQADFFLAVSDEAGLYSATGARGSGDHYSAAEEATKAARGADEGSLAEGMVWGLAGDPVPLRTWAAAHPDDPVAVAWWTWTDCPGPRCAEVDLGPLTEAWPGRGLPMALAQHRARELGRYDEAEQALDQWAAVASDEGSVPVERARLRLAQGRPDLAQNLLTNAPPRGRYPRYWATAGLAAARLSDEVALQRATDEAVRGAVSSIYLLGVVVGDDLVAEGRHAEAARTLDAALARMPSNDDISAEMAGELKLRRLALAARARDTTLAEQLAIDVRTLQSTARHFGWTRQRTGTQVLVAEGLRLAARGNTQAANKRLAELEASSPEHPDLRWLRLALAP